MSQPPVSIAKKYSIVILKKQPYLPKLHKNTIALNIKDQFYKCQQCKNSLIHDCFNKQVQAVRVSSLCRVKTQNTTLLDERRQNIKNKIKQRLISKMERGWQRCQKQQHICISNEKHLQTIKQNKFSESIKKLSVQQLEQTNKKSHGKAKLSPLRASKIRREVSQNNKSKQQKFRIEGRHMRNYLQSDDFQIYNFVSNQSYDKLANKKNTSQLVKSINNNKLQKLDGKFRSISALKGQNNYNQSCHLLEDNNIEPWNIEISY